MSSPPTPFFLGCSFGLVSVLKWRAVFDGIGWDQENNAQYKGLGLAASSKHVGVVRFLLEYNAVVHGARDGARASPLFIAATSGDKEIVQLLLEHEIGVTSRFSKRYMPLHVVAMQGRDEVVQLKYI